MIDRGERLRKLVMKFLVRSGLSYVSRPFLGGQGAILMLHRVTRLPGSSLGYNRNLTVDPDFLDNLIAVMKTQGFRFVSMDEAVRRIGPDHSEERFAAITLDDGFRDNLVEALPVFAKHGVPFCVYIATGLIEGTTEPWWDLVEAVIERRDQVTLGGGLSFDCGTETEKAEAYERICDHLTSKVAEEDQAGIVRGLAASADIDHDRFRRGLIMNWDEVRTIASHPLGTIGAHTVHHYNLSRLSAEKAFLEMSASASRLERELGVWPRHFAFPYGFEAAAGLREAQLSARAGFASAVTTRHGLIQPGHAGYVHCLPRISVNGRYQNVDYLKAMLSGATTPMANRGKRTVTV